MNPELAQAVQQAGLVGGVAAVDQDFPFVGVVEVGGLAGGLQEAGKLEVDLGQAKLFDGFGELRLVEDGVAGEFVVGDEVLDLGVGLGVILPGDRAVGEASGGGGQPGAVSFDDAAALPTEDDGAAPAGGGEYLGE